MAETESDFNPFKAPEESAVPELTLRDDDEFLISKKTILCREIVELPKVCVHYGETEGVTPRTKTLRILSGMAIVKILAAAGLILFIPMWLSMSRAPVLGSTILSVLLGITLVVAFAGIVWWSANQGLYKVQATWYTCERFNKRMTLYRWLVRGFLIAGVLWLGFVSRATVESLIVTAVFIGVISLTYNPEKKLQLTGKRNGAFVLQGHSTKFHEAVVRMQSGHWGQDAT